MNHQKFQQGVSTNFLKNAYKNKRSLKKNLFPILKSFVFLQELSHFGLAEDEKNSGRSVKSPGSSQSKRRSLLKSASSSVSIHILPQMDSRTLTKCHSIHNIKSQDAVFLVDNEEQSDAKKNSRSGGNRFITAVKHYLNLKTYSSSSSVPQRRYEKQHS